VSVSRRGRFTPGKELPVWVGEEDERAPDPGSARGGKEKRSLKYRESKPGRMDSPTAQTE